MKKPSFYIMIAIPIIVIVLAAGFFALYILNKNKTPDQEKIAINSTEETETTAETVDVFPDGYEILGLQVGGMTAKEAGEALGRHIEAYSIDVTMNGVQYKLTSAELGLSMNQAYDIAGELEALLTGKIGDAEAASPVEFASDQELIAALIGGYYQAKANAVTPEAESTEPETDEEGNPVQTTEADADRDPSEDSDDEAQPEEKPFLDDPTKAHVVFNPELGSFVTEDGTDGYGQDYTNALINLKAAAKSLLSNVLLNSEEKFMKGEKGSESLLAQRGAEAANERLKLELTYSFTPEGGEEKTCAIDRNALASFILIGSDGVTPGLDNEAIAAFCTQLYETYSVDEERTAQFRTASGKMIDVKAPVKGKTVDNEALFNDLVECLTNMTSGKRIAKYVTVSSDVLQTTNFGGTYVEIDLTEQRVYFFKNGDQLLESPCVSGKVVADHTTPPGVFKIFSKDRDRYLVGADYKSWVNYFMPFNGGIGMHDASWRDYFGGDIYVYSGSHGCINMPYSKAKELYSYVSVGTIVVVHGGRQHADKLTQEWGGTKNYEVELGSAPFGLNIWANEKPKYTFASSDPSVCTVSPEGVVTVVGIGTANITVHASKTDSYNESDCTLMVTVKEPVPETTEAPTTEAPTTAAPTTEAPTTAAPTTEAPTTAAHTTEAPTTAAHTTEASTTEAPTTETYSTEAPTTEADTTGETTTEPSAG